MASSMLFEPLRKLRQDCMDALDNYSQGGYHPILIGDFFENGRYEIVHKLGYGGYSTVWLAYDSRKDRYVALKFLSVKYSVEEHDFSMYGDSTKPNNDCNELKMIQYIAENVGEGSKKRLAVDVETFWSESVNGKHLVFVSTVNGPCLQDYMQVAGYTPDMRRKIALEAAKALRTLHKAGFVHGDFTTRNILIKLRNLDTLNPMQIEDCFGDITEEELIPRRGRIPEGSAPKAVFMEADMWNIPKVYVTNEVAVIDFGLSFKTTAPPPIDGTGSPYGYRAPEQMGDLEARLYLRPANEKLKRLTEKIDIWALACNIFEIQTGNQLFPPHSGDTWDQRTVRDVRDVMAEIWLEDNDDDWVYMGDKERVYDKPLSLRSRIENQRNLSRKEKPILYDLLKKMLKRKPSHRIGIEEVIQHRWFTTDFDPRKVLMLRVEEEEKMKQQASDAHGPCELEDSEELELVEQVSDSYESEESEEE